MYYWRRRENALDGLLRWRRNVFLQGREGEHLLVSCTPYALTIHHFDSSLRADPARTDRLYHFPAALFDGNGWNLALLQQLTQPERTTMADNQPFTALYCKPFRESIVRLDDAELRVFLVLATYADDAGTCFPGVRTLASDTGLGDKTVTDALHGLKNKGFMYYLRRGGLDPITRKILPDVYGLNASILRTSSTTVTQTYMHEFLSSGFPSDSAQPHQEPESINQNQELTPGPTTTNHHQDPDARASLEGLAQAPGKDYTNRAEFDILIEPDRPKQATPAAQPPPARSATQARPPRFAPPPVDPPDWGDLKAYTVPLTKIDQEAYANELQYRCDGLQLAKARQLVTVYGIETCSVAVGLMHNQPYGVVKNKSGWLINKLRQGALVPEDALTDDQRWFAMQNARNENWGTEAT